VQFAHDIVDGGPATRFTRRLIELIESGYGLVEPPDLYMSEDTGRPAKVWVVAPTQESN